ncbi:radical SAM protein [Lentzea sp. NPDC058436]|uniref:radical SAM protein n=1 Tax=Lentzea sp. NPDC058436 TaxID=3346499 RepID=UPI00366174A1
MRLVRGENGWWCIGRSATALLPDGLVRDGDLTSEGRVQLARTGIDAVPEPDHYSLTVVTSTSCNLGCSYCFQNTPDGRRRIAPARLDARNVARCVEFAERKMAELGVRRLELLLFGGEPLLNPAGCLQVLRAFGARMPVTASMISNGVLLTRRTATRLDEAGLGNVQVTLDGERDRHDRTRVTRGGRPTFDLILANVAAAQQHTGIRFTVRVNVTPDVLPHLSTLLDQAAGVLDVPNTNLAIAPVLDYGAGVPAPDARAAREAVQACAKAAELGFRLVRPRDDHCDFCSETGGRLGAVVAPDGTLFSCWDAVGEESLAVGELDTGYNEESHERWRRCGGELPRTQAFSDALDAGVLDVIRARREVTRS